jgi:tetratricopeptide (TPR) repeat protein
MESAIARGDPGLAVIYSESYRLYFPNDADAFRLLGDARVAEGNPDLALRAYSDATQLEGTDQVKAEVYVSRAELYMQEQRYNLALNDLTTAIGLRDTATTHAQRLRAAYAAGDYETAQEDINCRR